MNAPYTRCKFVGKPKLHGSAFFFCAGRKILPPMENKHYIKAWRRYRHLTQEQVIDRLVSLDDAQIPQTAASLSRLENGKQPYNERVLAALADIYNCEPWELIGSDPTKEGDIIDLMRHLDERERAQAMRLIEAIQIKA